MRRVQPFKHTNIHTLTYIKTDMQTYVHLNIHIPVYECTCTYDSSRCRTATNVLPMLPVGPLYFLWRSSAPELSHLGCSIHFASKKTFHMCQHCGLFHWQPSAIINQNSNHDWSLSIKMNIYWLVDNYWPLLITSIDALIIRFVISIYWPLWITILTNILLPTCRCAHQARAPTLLRRNSDTQMPALPQRSERRRWGAAQLMRCCVTNPSRRKVVQ